MIALIAALVLSIVFGGVAVADREGETLDIQITLAGGMIVCFTFATLTGPLV